MRYHFICDNRCSFPVTKMCQTFHISQSGYYRWWKSPVSVRQVKNKRLRERIQELYTEHRGMAGSPMITADLRAEPEFSSVGKNRVARQMKTMGLKCKTAKKYIVTTDSKHTEPVAPNLLNRQFSVASPNIAWVSDITYVKVGSKWNYLTVFIDLYSRIVVGWDLSASLDRHSMIYAFKKALLRRRPGQGLLVHSDRGVQYASADFRKLLQKTEFVQSMSRKGNCWDNAVAESFFHTLKTQFLYHHRFTNRSEAEQALFKYIEIYYNRRRRHSTNGYKSPALYELEWNNLRNVA
jgi:putative transposase